MAKSDQHANAIKLRAQILDAIAAGPLSPSQIAAAMWPDLVGQRFVSKRNLVRYHLGILAEEGLARAISLARPQRFEQTEAGALAPAFREERAYAIQIEPTDHGTVVVRFGSHWASSHAQGCKPPAAQGYSSIYSKVGL